MIKIKIVLLEELGVPNNIIENHAKKLGKMGHTFIAYKKNTNLNTQMERVKDADVIMIANMPLDIKVLKSADKLKFIDVAFTGVDHIPVEEAKKRKIAISNASGYATQAVAELCISFMIQLLRNMQKTEESCRKGGTKDGLIGNLLHGKTVGIIGTGAIGTKVAELCKAFECNVIAYNRSKIKNNSIDKQVNLEELLRDSDIVSLHCPLTTETKEMIGKKELSLMKKESILINTARGGIVNTLELAEALKNRTIAGAACDVFDFEPPLPLDYPLLHTPNTIVTPHIAFSSVESMQQRAEIVFNNLYAWLEGNQINSIF